MELRDLMGGRPHARWWSTLLRRTAVDDPPAGPGADDLWLASVCAVVPAALAVGDPNVRLLTSEDFCWRLATQTWSAGKASRSDRTARARWRQEGEALEAKRLRLVSLAEELGLVRAEDPGAGSKRIAPGRRTLRRCTGPRR
jgi:hypothetical protein